MGLTGEDRDLAGQSWATSIKLSIGIYVDLEFHKEKEFNNVLAILIVTD